MKNPCDRFKQRVSVVLTTQFPEERKAFAKLIQSMLGPWCKEAIVTLSNFDTEAYTPEQLDPMNDEEYVGHNIAIEMGVPCICEYPGSRGPKAFNCPHHGR